MLILMTAASFVHCRLGSSRPNSSPSSAVKQLNSTTAASASTAPASGACSAASIQTPAASAGTAVSSRCRSSLARSACQAVTGRLRISHRERPSSDTEGAVSRLTAEPPQMAQHTRQAAVPGSVPWTNARRAGAFHRAAAPSTGSSSVPSEALSR